MKKLASRKDSRIIDLLVEYGTEGYGIYALLVEYLKERKSFRHTDDIKRIAYELHADPEILRAVIEDFNLFEIADGLIINKNTKRKTPAPTPPVEAASDPEPTPEPTPAPDPEPDPEIESEPDPAPETDPKPEANPEPTPEPEPMSASSKRRLRRKRRREHLFQH